MRALALFAALTLSTPVPAETVPAITVTGEAQVTAEPDMAILSVGATAQAETAVEAMNQTSQALETVMARLTDQGIAARDMQTSSLSLNQRERYDNAQNRVVERWFEARNILTVRVRDLSTLSDTLGLVLEDGANTLNGLSFALQDPERIQEQARRAAVEDAMAKAALYAEAAGVSLGAVLSIRDTAEPVMRGAVVPQRAMMADAAPVPVAAGEIDARAQVTMQFSLGE